MPEQDGPQCEHCVGVGTFRWQPCTLNTEVRLKSYTFARRVRVSLGLPRARLPPRVALRSLVKHFSSAVSSFGVNYLV